MLNETTNSPLDQSPVIRTIVLFEGEDDAIRYRRLNEWVTLDGTEWIDKLYDDLYSIPGSARHRLTFKIIVLNLSRKKEKIYLSLNKKGYQGRKDLPKEFLPSKVSEICRNLARHGYLSLVEGYKFSDSNGVASSLEPSEKLLSLVPPKSTYRIRKEGLIRIKEFEPGSYPQHVLDAQKVLEEYNKTVEPENMLYATYKGNFLVDGRFTGSTFIVMPKNDRKEIEIDGKPTFEADIRNCVPFLLYANRLGRKRPCDAYDIPGRPRNLVKKAFLMALNCDSKGQARGAIQSAINKSFPGEKGALLLLEQIEEAHPDIDFYNGDGRKMMHLESRCMCKFLKRMLELGIKVYPVYDSVVGPEGYRNVIIEELRKAFTINGIEPDVHEEH